MKNFPFYIVAIVFFLITSIHTVFSEETIRQFEDKDMGIRLSYPSYWNESVGGPYTEKLGLLGCYAYYCHTEFEIYDKGPFNTGHMTIFSFDSEHPTFITYCQCNSLVEFVRDSYNSTTKAHEENLEKVFFIGDNQTSIGKNYSAWQIEYSIPKDNSKYLQIFAKSNNTFYYDITYKAESKESYATHLPEFKKLLNSVEFLPIQKSKTPSFMMSNQTQ